MLLMATKRMSYRDAEDQIRYYAPARYLCGLTETDWTPDFTTIQDFTELMGEEGIGLINEYAVELAVAEEHTSELQSQSNLVCRLLLEKKKKKKRRKMTK